MGKAVSEISSVTNRNHLIETISLICSANQWDGFYVMVTRAWNGNVDA